MKFTLSFNVFHVTPLTKLQKEISSFSVLSSSQLHYTCEISNFSMFKDALGEIDFFVVEALFSYPTIQLPLFDTYTMALNATKLISLLRHIFLLFF